MKSDRLSLGSKLKEFEKEFSKLIGSPYAIGVTNGTSGLHLCMKSIDLKPGDEVITSPFSFISSSNCILFCNAKPVFADIDSKTYNIDPEQIAQKITNKTKAILPVHVFGQPCDMKSIMEIAYEHDIPVVEDACESIGAEYDGKKVGTFGLSAVFSFYANKQITTAEGGMIVTKDEKIYKLCKSLSNQGRDNDDLNWLIHNRLGYNYRLDELSCALGLAQLRKLDFILKNREQIAKEYNKHLSKVDGITVPFVDPDAKHTWFLYVIKLDSSISRNKTIEYLRSKGIETKAYFFPPIHLQPFYKEMFGFKNGDFPICEEVSNSVLALPFFTGMEKSDIEVVCRTLEEAIK